MAAIIGISGSLRSNSVNRVLLREAAAAAPGGFEIEEESIAGIPLYDGDLEAADGIPQRVSELQDRLAAAHGLLLVTPEYNAGVPGVLKNAIDWLSRGGERKMRCFRGLPVALVGAGGRGGTRYSQSALLPTLRMLGAEVWPGRTLFAARSWELFDDGELVDTETREQLRSLVEAFCAHLEARPPRSR